MQTLKTLTLGLALTTMAFPALAQYRPEAPGVVYRDGMPSVNTPAPAADPNAGNYATSAGFARWYQAAGRPTLLLFWNRELIEDGTSQYDNVQSVRVDSVAASEAAAYRGRNVSTSAGVAGVSTVGEARQYQERTTNSGYGFRDNLFSKGVESAILSAFINAGARMVDREAVIRKQSAKGTTGEALDIQRRETLAMGQGIQYLIEVLPDDDLASPTGVSFTVKVTHLPTSTVRAQFVTTGDPPKGPAKIVAVAGAGFEKRTADSRKTPQTIGSQVAYDTMAKLR